MKQPIYQMDNPETAKKRLQLISDVVLKSQTLFGGFWDVHSVWRWIGFLQEEIDEVYDLNSKAYNLDESFFWSNVDQIDFKQLGEILEELNELDRLLANIGASSSEVEFSDKWYEVGKQIGLSTEGTDLFLSKVQGLVGESRDKAMVVIKELLPIYTGFHAFFSLQAAVWLYYTPDDPVLTLEEFEEKLDSFEKSGARSLDDLQSIMRYFGECYQGRESRMRNWVIDFLGTAPLTKETLEDGTLYLIFSIMLFISFRDFKELLDEDRVGLVWKYAWSGILMGMPVDELIKDSLANQPFVNYYTFYSGAYADVMGYSTTPIYFLETDKTTKLNVGDLLGRFLNKAGEKDLDGYFQSSFVNELIVNNKWPDQLKNILLKLLYLYVHLREMDLIDYKAFLSEEGVKEYPFDWKAVVQRDLTEDDKEQIKRHFVLLKRAVKLKAELVVAFESVDWKQEPYLHRVLVINELYTDVYGTPFAPLVLFDEEAGGWHLNKELPNAWKDFNFLPAYLFKPEEGLLTEEEQKQVAQELSQQDTTIEEGNS